MQAICAIVADGACGLLFCAAKPSGAFPSDMPVGFRLAVGWRVMSRNFHEDILQEVFHLQPCLKLGPRLFVITGEEVIGRSRSFSILMAWWSAQRNDSTNASRRR
jgi:hypothetical protein